MKKIINKESGLVRMVIMIIIAIAVLSYYGVDIKDFFTSEQFQKNFGYVWNFITDIWSNYLTEPAHKVYEFWLKYFWGPFMDMLNREDHANILNP